MRVASVPGIFLVALFALFVLPSAAVFWTDWLWFIEAGYLPVFEKSIRAQVLTFGVTAGLAFLFV